jgi:hypothetical protein
MVMGGLALRTIDGCMYPITLNVAPKLIIKGVLIALQVRGRDIKDRVKGDTFAKALTVFQSGWLAAWNFSSPTAGEKIAWRAFSVVSTALVLIVYISAEAPRILKRDHNEGYAALEEFVAYGGFLIYNLARIGIMVLTLMSLQSLPAACYVLIDWHKSIPYI